MYESVRVVKSVGHQDGAAKADSTSRGVLLQNLHGGQNDAPRKRKIMEPATNSILLDLPAASLVTRSDRVAPRASKFLLTLELGRMPDAAALSRGYRARSDAEIFSKPGNLDEERLQQAEVALRMKATTGDRVQPRSDGTSQW